MASHSFVENDCSVDCKGGFRLNFSAYGVVRCMIFLIFARGMHCLLLFMLSVKLRLTFLAENEISV